MKKFLLLITLILFTLPVLAKNTILILGDSISAGYGININKGWVALLQQRLKQEKYDYHVINSSISGNTTSNGLGRIEQALATHQPQITIIELGGNDGLRGLPLSTIKSNLTKIIQLAKTAKSRVLLIGVQLPPNYGVDYTQGFQDIFTEVGNQYQVPVVSLFLEKRDNNTDLIQADGLHPTEKAQPLMLDQVWPAMKKLLK